MNYYLYLIADGGRTVVEVMVRVIPYHVCSAAS
jgi:hypothetical protein